MSAQLLVLTLQGSMRTSGDIVRTYTDKVSLPNHKPDYGQEETNIE